MTGRSVHGAITLLVVGNLLAMFSDVIIKLQGQEVAVFQFVFMRALASLLWLLPLLAVIDRTVLFRAGRLHLLRAHVGIAAFACVVLALTTLPLATANAVFYTAPIIIMLLGVGCFGERVTALSVLAAVCGFVGILVALRPLEFSWQALSALGAAFALSLNALLVRRLPEEHTAGHALVLTQIYGLPTMLALCLWEGAPWDWGLMLAALGSATFILAYQLTVLLAYRHVAANQVSSAEYTGIIWAVLLGWWWFGEVPDLWFASGTLLIIGPLLLHGLVERRRARSVLAATG